MWRCIVSLHKSAWLCRWLTQQSLQCQRNSSTCVGEAISLYFGHVLPSLPPYSACPLKVYSGTRLEHLQGREKDVAIFSTVRDGKKHGSIGFVADERRVNVGLTRARSSLIVIGNAKALKTDERWGNLVKQAMEDGSVPCASPVSCIQSCTNAQLPWQYVRKVFGLAIASSVVAAGCLYRLGHWMCLAMCIGVEQIVQRFE